jgi:hypothetical protein
LELRRLIASLVGEVQIIIEHFDERPAIGRFVPDPHVVDVVIGRDVDSLLPCRCDAECGGE